MPGAAGAYAASTGTIYLNQDWLAGASLAQVVAVLTEELGHYLDGLLNSSDTHDDEGELFSVLLTGDGVVSTQQRRRIVAETDSGKILIDHAGSLQDRSYIPDEQLDVEFALAYDFRPSVGVGIAGIADAEVFNLASDPSSNKTIYLDFDGADLSQTHY